jgi:hypothetical protein
MTRTLSCWAWLLLAAALGGCAATRLDAVVHTAGSWPAGRVTSGYAFQRLPSQQSDALQQERVEADAVPAIELAGFKPVPAESAEVLVQVAARMIQVPNAFADPAFGPLWPGVGVYGGRWHGAGWGYGPGWGWGYGAGYGYGYAYYAYEAAVLIVDARSGHTLYETRARSDGGWPDPGGWQALFRAAMKDFPLNAVSPRRVIIDLPQESSMQWRGKGVGQVMAIA